MKLKSLLLICMISIGSNTTLLNAAFYSNDYSHDASSLCKHNAQPTSCLLCFAEEKKANSSAYPDQNAFDTTSLFPSYISTNPQSSSSSSYYTNPKSSTDDTSIDALPEPKPKKIKTPQSSWFSTLCVLTSLGIIGYDIYGTNKLKKEEADDAVTEPFLTLRNPSKVTEEPVKKAIDTKEIEEEEKEVIQEEVIAPKPILNHSRQRPIKPVTPSTIEPEKTDPFAFIKDLQKNLHDKIKPQYKAGKKQGKFWFNDLKQNPRQHKKLAAAATLFTLALIKNWVPGLKHL